MKSSSTVINVLSRVESQVERARELYPGPEEQKADPYLVEFEPGDPENPMVRTPHELIPCLAWHMVLIFLLSLELVQPQEMVFNTSRRDAGLKCVRVVKRHPWLLLLILALQNLCLFSPFRSDRTDLQAIHFFKRGCYSHHLSFPHWLLPWSSVMGSVI